MGTKFSDKLTKEYIILNAQKYHSMEAMTFIKEAFIENKMETKINRAISTLKYILELEKEKTK